MRLVKIKLSMVILVLTKEYLLAQPQAQLTHLIDGELIMLAELLLILLRLLLLVQPQ